MGMSIVFLRQVGRRHGPRAPAQKGAYTYRRGAAAATAAAGIRVKLQA